MKNILILLTAAIFISSCASETRIFKVKNKLNGIETQIQKENVEVQDLKKETYKKYRANKIDSNILIRIEEKLGKLDTAKILANQLKEILKDEKKTKWKYRSIVLPVLDSLKKINDQ